MKKLLPSVTLAFASLAALTGSASAGHTFGLFTHHCCCKGCGGTITLRQYNAFSPVACGSMVFQGCVVAPPPAPAPYGDFGGYGGGECIDGSCAPGAQLPANISGAAYTYPAYSYNPAVQMPRMPAVPVQYQGAQPAAARVP